MEQNDNKDKNVSYSKDDAYKSLEMINTWINNIDTKVSFALALTGVFIGIIFEKGVPKAFQIINEVTKLSELNGADIIAIILVCLLYIMSFLSIISFMLAIIARVRNLNNARSIFFFGTIETYELQDYKDKLRQITEQEILEDLEEQIHTNSRICNRKIKWYNIGMKLLLITIIIWFICMVFRLI